MIGLDLTNYLNGETAQTAREEVAKRMQNILVELAERSLQDQVDDFLAENWPGFLAVGWMCRGICLKMMCSM